MKRPVRGLIVNDDEWVKNLSRDYPLEKLQRVQRTLLQIMKEVDAIFRENGIQYFIFWGTLLGAVRHGGFVPWDDDLDVCVFESEYEKAIGLLRKRLSATYIVQDILSDDVYGCDWAKIRDLNSEAVSAMFPEENKLTFRGVYLDVYKVATASISELRGKVFRQRRELSLEVVTTNRWGRPLWKRIGHRIRARWYESHVAMIIEWIYVKLLYSGEPYVYWTSETRWTRIVPLGCVVPTKDITFESLVLSGPQKADAALRCLYGDYLRLPSLVYRAPRFSSVTFSSTTRCRPLYHFEGKSDPLNPNTKAMKI
jgi:lipopolysaccharide cholinephosphotransferase